ncbi:MAG: DUF732 domain-containing protein [Actinomycetia bacterium]|nr:DUF732 domain-containing protein [Actinomycetes bacterium]MCH9700898.1 DUF732 domain-containing protein [Actinomycetes bacterium]MCH9760840.1 DUF732 domain-containing protein [Actinomycetes bacterium]
MAGASLLLVSSAAWLTGCSPSDEAVVRLGTELDTAPAHGWSGGQAISPSPSGAQSEALVVTPRQRAYLDALDASGVTPSSELDALSIGSYVCHAYAASQNDQAVWDFVTPMVRDDLVDSDNSNGVKAMAPSAGQLRSATAIYIRVATERLC